MQESGLPGGIKTRNVSLDVLRVLAMFMIVLGHCLVHGDVIDAAKGVSSNYYPVQVLNTFLQIHVNCFVLVSGYFLCESDFKVRTVLKIWGAAFFWSVLLYLFINGVKGNGFSIYGILNAAMPFMNRRYWFVTTYLLMYLLAPAFNAAIHSMNQRQHLSAILTYFLVFILFANGFYWIDFTLTNAHHPLYFGFLYFVAAYIRRYPPKKKHPWFFGYVLCMGFSAAWSIIVPMITQKLIGSEWGGSAFSAFTSVTVVLGATCFFMTFLQTEIRGGVLSKMASMFSPLAFGVYLIHEQPEIRTWLWQEMLQPFAYADSPYLLLIVFGMSIGVFVMCAALEKVRIKLFDVLKIDRLYIQMDRLCTKLNMLIIEKLLEL